MAEDTRKFKILCSYGSSGQSCLLSLHRSSSFRDLVSKISRFFDPPFHIKYHLPDADSGELVTIADDDDLVEMREEFSSFDETYTIKMVVFASRGVGNGGMGDLGFCGVGNPRGGNSGNETLVHNGNGELHQNGNSNGSGLGPIHVTQKTLVADDSLDRVQDTLTHPEMELNGNGNSFCPVHVTKSLVEEVQMKGNGHPGAQSASTHLYPANGAASRVVGDNMNRVEGNENSFPVGNSTSCNCKTGQKHKSFEKINRIAAQIVNRNDDTNSHHSVDVPSATPVSSRISRQGISVSNPHSFVSGAQPVLVRNCPILTTGFPNQVTANPRLEENAYSTYQNYVYTNSGRDFYEYHHQPLYQLVPVPQLYNLTLPLTHESPVGPGPHQAWRMNGCQMCQGAPQCRSNMLGSESNKIDAVKPVHLFNNSEIPMRLPDANMMPRVVELGTKKVVCSNGRFCDSVIVEAQPKVAVKGLVDNSTEAKTESTYASYQLAAYRLVPKLNDDKNPVQKNVEMSIDQCRVFAMPSTTGLPSRNQSQHDGCLQQLPQTSSKQSDLVDSSANDVISPATEAPGQVFLPEIPNDCHRPLDGRMEAFQVNTYRPAGLSEQKRLALAVNGCGQRDIKFGDAESQSCVSIAELPCEYVKPTNGIKEGLPVNSLKPTEFNQQQGLTAAVSIGIPGDCNLDNMPIAGNNQVIRSQICENSVFDGNSVTVVERNPVKLVNPLPARSMDLKPEQHVVPAVDTNGLCKLQVCGSAVDVGDSVVRSGIVPESNHARPINDMPPSSMEAPHLSNTRPSEIFQKPTLMDSHGSLFSYTKEVTFEAEFPIKHSLCSGGVTNPACNHNFTINSNTMEEQKTSTNMSIPLPALDQKNESFNSCVIDVNMSGLPSCNVTNQLPTYSCPSKHFEHFEGSISSNQDPQQILGSMRMVPSNQGKVCNEGFHHPQSLMREGSCLDSLLKSQGEELQRVELQAAAKQLTTPVLQSFVPAITTCISDEKKEFDCQSNKESVLDADLKSAMSLDESKVEGTKDKHSDNENLGFPIIDGRLQIIKNGDLEELAELGSGTFGTVYHGKWRGSDVAIKRIHNRYFDDKPAEEERMRADFWNEASKLADLHHPNVVAFYGAVLDGPGGSYATVTEFMVNGSLRQALQKNDGSFNRQKRLIIAMDVAFGMEYLHSKKIVHFDLKSDNLLVNLSDPQRPICKVADLGLSKVKRQTFISGGVKGTLPWMAPELLNGHDCLVSEKVDVYSFGIVMWELLTGQEPYANLHYGNVIGGMLKNELRPPVPDYCDPDWRMLMEQCWSNEPLVRPSFTEIASRLRSMAVSPPKGESQAKK